MVSAEPSSPDWTTNAASPRSRQVKLMDFGTSREGELACASSFAISRSLLSLLCRQSCGVRFHVCPIAACLWPVLISTFTLPFLKYIRVGMSVSPRCCVLPISLRISSLCTSSLRVRKGA